MSTLRTLKKLVLGETWTVPIGIAALLGAGALVRLAAPGAWSHVGGMILLAGTLLVLVRSVSRTARRR